MAGLLRWALVNHNQGDNPMLKIKKTRSLWLALLVVLVLACTSVISEAEANETYNFYFQKAPGPVTVNQGTGGANVSTPAAAVVDTNGQLVAAPSVVAAVPVSAASVATAESPSRPRWYLSVGGSTMGKGTNLSTQDLASGKSEIDPKSYSVALEYELVDRMGIILEGARGVRPRSRGKAIVAGYGYVHKKNAYGPPAADELYDAKPAYSYSLSAAFDLFRTDSERTAKFVLGPIGGVGTYSYIRYDKPGANKTIASDGFQTELSPFAGVRARMLMFDRMGVEASARRLFKAKEYGYRFAVAYAF